MASDMADLSIINDDYELCSYDLANIVSLNTPTVSTAVAGAVAGPKGTSTISLLVITRTHTLSTLVSRSATRHNALHYP